MPIVTTSPITFQINDLANEVIIKVENRISDIARAYVWLKDALIEIASNPEFRSEFDELAEFGPTYNLIVGTQEYSETVLVPTGDFNMATLDIVIWPDFPTNAMRKRLDPSSFQETDKFTINASLPTKWYRFGGSIGFYPVPDKTYQVQARILRYHPINDTAIQNTVILLPRDWNEILVWSAAQRGFMELEEYEKAKAIAVLLHGDVKHPERPGLLSGRKKKSEREAWRSQGMLRPVVRPYTYGGRR